MEFLNTQQALKQLFEPVDSISGSSNLGAPAPLYPEVLDYDAIYKAAQPKKYAPSYVTDYNDPYAINSVADVYLNMEAKKRRYGSWANNPLLSATVTPILGAVDLLYNQTIKPIVGNAVYGYQNNNLLGGVGTGIKQAGLNLLTNVGETLDVFSNPIKATLIEGADALGLGNYGSQHGGNVLKGLSTSMGIGDAGRTNYSWDTGNMFSDLFLEIVSDPVNWYTWGSKALISSGAGKAIGTAVKEVVGEGAETISKKIAKQFSKAFLNSSDDVASVASRFFINNNPGTIKDSGQVFSNPQLNKIIKGVLTPEQAIALGERVLTDMQSGVVQGVNQMRLGKNAYGFIDRAQTELLKSALHTSGITGVFTAGKKVSSQIIEPVLKLINEVPNKVASQTYIDITSSLLQRQDDVGRVLRNFVHEQAQNGKGSDLKLLQQLYYFSAATADVVKTDEMFQFVEELGQAYRHAQLPMDPISKFIYHKITPLYKTGYLSNPGFPIRNSFDGLVRNATQLGGLEHLGEVSDDFVRAMGDEQKYQNILERIVAFGREGYDSMKWDIKTKKRVKVKVVTDTVNADVINAYFKANKVTELPLDVFRNYHRLINDPSSVIGGMTSEVRNIVANGNPSPKVLQLFESDVLNKPAFSGFIDDVLKQKSLHSETPKSVVAQLKRKYFGSNKAVHPSVARKLVEDAMEFASLPMPGMISMENFEVFLKAKYKKTDHFGILSVLMDKNPILQVNEAVERALRWSMYQQQRALGYTHGETIQKIIKTHFVYDNKPFALKLAETYLPFTGFTLKNFNYWADMLSHQSPYAFSEAVRNFDLKVWQNLVDDVRKLPVYSYKAPQVYNMAASKLAEKYLGRNTSSAISKQFAAHVKHFVQSHSVPNSKNAFEAYVKSMARAPKAGTVFNNLGNFMNVISRPDEQSNPELYDYAGMERPGVFATAPEHPYMNISKGMEYQILGGNIVYGKPSKDLSDPKQRKELMKVFKLNPSWMDALQFGSNPIESVWDRLLPFLNNAIERAKGGNKSDLEYILDSVPILGTMLQRYQPVKNRWESTKDLSMFEPSIFGTVSSYPQFSPSKPDPTASEDLVKMWFGQYKGGNLKHNPYDTYPQYANGKTTVDERSAAEKELAGYYAKYKTLNLPSEYDPYKVYPELAAQAYAAQAARYGTLDPSQLNPNASEQAVKFWYKQYKEQSLPYKYNPYQYYPQYGFKAKSTPKSIASSTAYQDLKKLYEGYYSGTGTVQRPMTTYYRQAQRMNRAAYPRNFYKDLYTSTGVSRIELRLGKNSVKNLRYRMSDIKYLFQKNWAYIR